ncbi:MAG: exodeoxyribonuclease VII small subunit [Planctomycetaceae bacterium]|nr:exodeoxyribonuclease VII small subunit [Planctomycetaceae bacterium]
MAKKRSRPAVDGLQEASETTVEPTAESLTVEEAMAELSQIVRTLESGQEPLHESLQLFERGMRLMRLCHRQLDTAAQRIEIITRLGSDGTVVTAQFDSESTLQRKTQELSRSVDPDELTGDDADRDNGTLF